MKALDWMAFTALFLLYSSCSCYCSLSYWLRERNHQPTGQGGVAALFFLTLWLWHSVRPFYNVFINSPNVQWQNSKVFTDFFQGVRSNRRECLRSFDWQWSSGTWQSVLFHPPLSRLSFFCPLNPSTAVNMMCKNLLITFSGITVFVGFWFKDVSW